MMRRGLHRAYREDILARAYSFLCGPLALCMEYCILYIPGYGIFKLCGLVAVDVQLYKGCTRSRFFQLLMVYYEILRARRIYWFHGLIRAERVSDSVY